MTMSSLFSSTNSKSASKPTTSIPVRVSGNRKRDAQEATRDENALRVPQTYVRKRCDSNASVASVETIRARTPSGAGPAPPQNNVAGDALELSMEKLSIQKPKPALNDTTTHNGMTPSRAGVNIVAFPTDHRKRTGSSLPFGKVLLDDDDVTTRKPWTTKKKKGLMRVPTCHSRAELFGSEPMTPSLTPESVSPEEEKDCQSEVLCVEDDSCDPEFDPPPVELCTPQEGGSVGLVFPSGNVPTRPATPIMQHKYTFTASPRAKPSANLTKNRDPMQRFEVDILPSKRSLAMWDHPEQ